MLLEGKKLLITGVLTPQSIAFAAAQVCQEQGAEVVLTSFGRAMSLTEKSATPAADARRRAGDGRERPRADRGGQRRARVALGDARRVPARDRVRARRTRWAATSSTRRGRACRPPFQTSAFSLKAIAAGMLPADAGARRRHRVAGLRRARSRGRSTTGWACARPALESVTRYLARDLGPHGIRVNTCQRRSAQDHRRQGHPGVRRRSPTGGRARAPLGWDITDPTPVGRRDRVPALGLRRRASPAR